MLDFDLLLRHSATRKRVSIFGKISTVRIPLIPPPSSASIFLGPFGYIFSFTSAVSHFRSRRKGEATAPGTSPSTYLKMRDEVAKMIKEG